MAVGVVRAGKKRREMKVAGRCGVEGGSGRFVMVFGFGESDAFGGWCVQDRDRGAGVLGPVLVSEVGGVGELHMTMVM